MNILSEAIRLITRPPGDLVYFLVILFALQQGLFPAITSRRIKSSKPATKRWLWCIGGLLASRIILMSVALLGNVDIVDPATVMPPLERWLAFVSIVFVMWAALFNTSINRWQTVILALLVALSLVYYGFDAITWSSKVAESIAYNTLLQAQLWEVLSAVFLLGALILTFVLRPREWEWAVGIFFFWLLGHVAQLFWPDVQIHFSGWQRLFSLVTFPLLSVLVHKQLFAVPKAPARQDIFPDSNALVALIKGVETARELEPSLIIASSRLARLLDAEMCAVALTSKDNASKMRVVAVHPPNAAQIETPEMEWQAYAPLSEACTTQQPTIIQPPSEYPWLSALYGKLGFRHLGPLVALPMFHNKQNIGLLLLGNPDSGRSWSRNVLNGHKLTATLFAAAIVRARTQDTSVFARLRGKDAEPSQLESDLETTRAQINTLNERIETLTHEIETREKEVIQLTRDLEARDGHVSETELSFWQNEVRELSQDREMLLEDRNRVAEQLTEMKARLDTSIDERDKTKAQFDKMQEELELIKQDLDAAQKGAAHGLIVVDENGQIVTADALARRMLRLPQGDVTGMPIDGAYPDPNWAKSIEALLSDRPNAKRRAHVTLKEFEGIVDADLVTLVGRDGIPDGLIITLRTSESAAERQEAIVSLANEFRTPMTAITGYTDLLLGEQAGLLTEMQQQFLERVKANVEQLGHLLNDVISIASPDSRPVELSPQLINLIEIIEEAIMGLAARFRERKLAVRLDLPPELSLVRADRDSLYQIMLRLLSNAALCSREGTEVIIRATQETAGTENGDYICIAVVDTGGGIFPEDYTRVFRRFYRARQTLIQGMGETGIGMAVAKTLVEANGGRIWVESEPGVGSTFSFILTANNES